MVRKVLAGVASLLFVVGMTRAAEPEQLNGTFVKFDSEKNEITIKANGKTDMTFMVSQDVKVAVGEVRDLKKLKPEDPILLTFKKDGDKLMVIEVRQGKQPRGSSSPSQL